MMDKSTVCVCVCVCVCVGWVCGWVWVGVWVYVYVYLVGLSWILRLYRERAGFICSLGSTDFHFTL